MRKLALAAVTTLSFVASVLVPALPATSASPTVTKEFSITKSDGSAYAGVIVALIEYDEDLNEIVLSETETTNSAGIATIEVPSDKDYYAWAAQPGSGDLTHALLQEY
jgi:hypothetical protein